MREIKEIKIKGEPPNDLLYNQVVFAETPLLERIKDFFYYDIFIQYIYRPIDNLKDYLKEKFIYKRHIIKTGLKPNYHSNKNRILYGNFNILKDFVEKSGAFEIYDWSVNKQKKEAKKEIMILYKWWINRKKRKDPFEKYHKQAPLTATKKHKDKQSGRLFWIYKTKAHIKRSHKLAIEAMNLENKHLKEDTEMLVRLAKVSDWIDT